MFSSARCDWWGVEVKRAKWERRNYDKNPSVSGIRNQFIIGLLSHSEYQPSSPWKCASIYHFRLVLRRRADVHLYTMSGWEWHKDCILDQNKSTKSNDTQKCTQTCQLCTYRPPVYIWYIQLLMNVVHKNLLSGLDVYTRCKYRTPKHDNKSKDTQSIHIACVSAANFHTVYLQEICERNAHRSKFHLSFSGENLQLV